MDFDIINVILAQTTLNYGVERVFVVNKNTLVVPTEKYELKNGLLKWY